jgi:hypothetical protein
MLLQKDLALLKPQKGIFHVFDIYAYARKQNPA